MTDPPSNLIPLPARPIPGRFRLGDGGVIHDSYHDITVPMEWLVSWANGVMRAHERAKAMLKEAGIETDV